MKKNDDLATAADIAVVDRRSIDEGSAVFSGRPTARAASSSEVCPAVDTTIVARSPTTSSKAVSKTRHSSLKREIIANLVLVNPGGDASDDQRGYAGLLLATP